ITEAPAAVGTKLLERARTVKLQKTRWFKKGQKKWRTGCGSMVSALKRRHGLTRCRHKGDDGMIIFGSVWE
ncbi:MAG: hypothetical protein ACRD9L_04200, partial [Bryobacteraceae bacterium]